MHTNDFFSCDGPNALLSAITSGEARVQAKALHFLRCLMEQSPEREGVLTAPTMGAAVLTALNHSREAAVWEHGLSVLGKKG